jgi:alpha-ketoglutarate-dependent taurine dioxygenase
VPKSSYSQLQIGGRKSVKVSQAELINFEYFNSQNSFPLIVKPNIEDLSLTAWADSDRSQVEIQLLRHGAILFRGFKVDGIEGFEQFIQTIAGNLLKYDYGSTPRSRVSGNIYTSTEYPASQFIPLHNEMSYSRSYPSKIAFYCLKQAESGGETPIADSRRVSDRLSHKLKQKFIESGVMYVRNYRHGIDLSWQNSFNTTDKSEVECYCKDLEIKFEWKDKDCLRTSQVCQAIAIHPQTGEEVWFNQAHLFHISQLEPTVRQQLLADFAETDLPRNAYYGDGSPIEDSVLEEIRSIYQQETITFPWQEGDVLLLDNLLAAHGRNPFTGSRRVVVGMA